jgi:hypothetical protein
MVLVVVSIVVLTVLSTTLFIVLNSEQNRSNTAATRDAAFQAAEAGIHTYMAKLLDDPNFYLHYIAKGESTRKSSGGVTVAGDANNNVAWSYGNAWTYANGFGNWHAIGNGYEYSLQVVPPSASAPGVGITAVGRKVGSTTSNRKIETLIRPASVTDFQMLANEDISYGSGATTKGKIYAGQDSGGVKHDVEHKGTAYADIYAEGDVTGGVTMMGTAKKYDGDSIPNIRTKVANPINFSSFLTSMTDIQAAAQAAGVYLNNSSKAGWYLKFSNNGTFTAQSCDKTLGLDLEDAAPTCGSATTYSVPSNGAIYVAQSVVVQNATTGGGVKGRVTVASNNNVVVADNIGPVTVGVDVVGLVAANNMYVASWGPYNLTWSAGTISQTGRWESAPGALNGSHGTMTFTGSTATAKGGQMGMFDTRVYQYEPTFLYLPPPWFPVIGDALTIVLFRELPA